MATISTYSFSLVLLDTRSLGLVPSPRGAVSCALHFSAAVESHQQSSG